MKKEGKLLTKVEKERKMKNEAQLEALRKQGRKICRRNKFLCRHTGGGVVIPGISHTHDTGNGAVKKPVRYGTRVRNKQKKDSHQLGEGDQGKKEEPDMEVGSKPLEEEQETEPMTKGATGLNVLMLYLLVLCVSQEEMLLQKIQFLIIGKGRQPAQKR